VAPQKQKVKNKLLKITGFRGFLFLSNKQNKAEYKYRSLSGGINDFFETVKYDEVIFTEFCDLTSYNGR
jgi:hypothetical protein